MRHAQADSTRRTGNAKRFLPGSIPASGVVSGGPAGKRGQRVANPDTRVACAPQQKSLARTPFNSASSMAPPEKSLIPGFFWHHSAIQFHLSGFKRALLASLLLCALLSPALAQSPVPANRPSAYPAWWFEREVIKRTDPQNASPAWPGDYSQSDDFSVINQGQLKNLAVKANAELHAKLPFTVWTLSAGTALQTLITDWSTSTTADNYAVVNQGQLKTVAKIFYDVLAAAGYTAGLNLPPIGWISGTYPWTDVTTDDDNYAVVNAGQAKRLFSFDLSAPTGQLPAWWMAFYFPGQTGILPGGDEDGDDFTNLQEYENRSNPNNYYSQPDGQGGSVTITPTITIISGNNQIGNTEEYLADALKVEVRNSANNALLPHAPVVFTVTSGGGGLAEQSGSETPSETLTVSAGDENTGTNGIAQGYYKQGDGAESTISAQGGTSAVVTFTSRSIANDGLWCRWKMDEKAASTAAEARGLPFNGTLMNQTAWTGGFNNQGGVEFSGFSSEGGTGAYVTMGNPADRSLDFGNDSFSIALWVKYTDGTFPEGQTGRRIISKGNYGFNAGYTIALEGTGQLYAGIGATQGGASQALFFHTAAEYNDGKWHHVTAVFDRQNSAARIYVDGVAQELAKESNTGGTIDPAEPTMIDHPDLSFLSATNTETPLTVSSHMGVSDFFKGGVDDVRFYRKALEGPEVEALRNIDSDGDELPDWWEMENGFDPNDPDENHNGVLDGLDDTDGDGVNNVTEYRQGRNPRAGAVTDTEGVLDFRVYTRLEN